MAGADYYSCDVCGFKTFYDAELSYEKNGNHNPKTGHMWPNGNVGDMAVICKECSKTHLIQIDKRTV